MKTFTGKGFLIGLICGYFNFYFFGNTEHGQVTRHIFVFPDLPLSFYLFCTFAALYTVVLTMKKEFTK